MAKSNQQTTKGTPFSIVSCVVGCFLVLACIALAYIAGVMTGRASAARDNTHLGLSHPHDAVAPITGEDKVVGVLSPEELEYARVLRSDTALRGKKSVAPGNVVILPKKDVSGAGAIPSNISVEATTKPQEKVEEVPQVGMLANQHTAPTSSQDRVALFDYVFQVAAMRTEDSVDGLRQRLEGRGLRTRMQREGKMYYVLVMLRGDEARASEVVQILDSMRLGKPLVRSRKPVIQ